MKHIRRIIIAVVVTFIVIGIYSSNFFRQTGEGYLAYSNNPDILDTLCVKGRYNYYLLDWQVIQTDSARFDISGKGWSRFDMYGYIQMRTNYYSGNLLDLKDVNHMLQTIETDVPYLFCSLPRGDSSLLDIGCFLMISKTNDIYNNQDSLLNLAVPLMKLKR